MPIKQWDFGIPKSHKNYPDALGEHPLVEKALDMCINTGTHPSDFTKRNLGIWTHPVTGEKHIVASDSGFSLDVLRKYQQARRAMRSHMQNLR
jgi:hypothetical protein